MNPAPAAPRILAVKLADFGDGLLATPALRRLRLALPGARIDVLTTSVGAIAFGHSGLVDDILKFDKTQYDRPIDSLSRPLAPLRLGRTLRARGYDGVALFHSLVTRYGAAKHAAVVLATAAPVRAGLVAPGSRRGWFLTHVAVDLGYDHSHVVASNMAVADALLAGLAESGSARLAGAVGPSSIEGSGSTAGPSSNVGSSTPNDPTTMPPADLRLAFDPGPAAESAAAALLASIPEDGRPRVAIHPGTGAFSGARRWTPEGFAAVADGLAGRGAHVVLVGTPADGTAEVRARCRAPLVDLTGRTDLPALAALLARMDLFVGNDSGVTHLATAMGTPVVAVFGPSNPVAWGPWWPGVDAAGRPTPSPHRVVALDLPCRPCFYVGHRLGSPRGCETRDCLAWLPAGRVLAAAVAVLERGDMVESPSDDHAILHPGD